MEWIRGTFIGGMVINAEYRTKLDRSFAEYKAGLGQKHELLDVKDI